MAFSLDDPGFCLESREDSMESAAPEEFSQQSSMTCPSMPSSGDSARRNCPRCLGRMSSFSVDRHSFCSKCCGSECNIENRCDECMSWSVEEMESYVKLRKSLASKSHGRKGSSSKASSSPGPSAPFVLNVSDVDDRISSQFAIISREFDKKLETVSDGILSKFSDFVSKIEDGLTNRSLSAEPEGPGRKPLHGQSLPLRHSVSIGNNHRQFQSDVGGPVPLGSGFAHPSASGESLDGVLGVGPEPGAAGSGHSGWGS